MPFIHITVEGLDDVTSGINRFVSESGNIKRDILTQVSDFMAMELRNNAHVITGRMKASIRTQYVSDSQYLVEVGAPYAAYENARVGGVQGPHDFADRAEQATRDMFGNVVSSIYGNFFSSL